MHAALVIKLHGDYRDTRIRNTTPELETYEAEMDDLLDRIFDEYGLIICGWCAAWDGGILASGFCLGPRR
jgi:hypothetical protein